MGDFKREDLKARYYLFDHFALNDQRNYYQVTVAKHKQASTQVNHIRATINLLIGVFSALAGLLAAVYYVDGASCSATTLTSVTTAECSNIQLVIGISIIFSIALPAIGGFFNTLADLYQWDRLMSIYNSAVKNINVADALSPDEESPDEEYISHLYAYIEGTLQVMSDETAQWGQNIRAPKVTENFIEGAKVRSDHIRQNFAGLEGASDPPTNNN